MQERNSNCISFTLTAITARFDRRLTDSLNSCVSLLVDPNFNHFKALDVKHLISGGNNHAILHMTNRKLLPTGFFWSGKHHIWLYLCLLSKNTNNLKYYCDNMFMTFPNEAYNVSGPFFRSYTPASGFFQT